MCTAAGFVNGGLYFGRNLDYEFSYGESVTVTPRRFPFSLRHMGEMKEHYAMIGMAHVAGGVPLYYDGMNEKGLCIAGLNFVGNAVYGRPVEGKTNIAQFELIPWILGSCADLSDVKKAAEKLVITDTPFNDQMPVAQMHWLIGDKTGFIVLEQQADGLHVYDDPAGVLTNNPPFPVQNFALNNYAGLSPKTPENRFGKNIPLESYSRGMGAIGLPGDLSSQSRFIRAAFVTANSLAPQTEEESVSQFFHILTAVEQQRGCCELPGEKYEITIYSSCCSAETGTYYYTTYDNRQLTAVSLFHEDLEGKEVVVYPMRSHQAVQWEN